MLDEQDVLLIQQHKDHAAFERLYRRWHDKIKYTTGRYYIQDEHDIEDFLQEFWIRVWENIDKFEHRSAFGTWLYRVLKNSAINYVTRKNRVRSVEEQFDEMDEEMLFEPDITLDQFDMAMIDEAFERAEKRLPPPILEVWKMYHNGMSYQQMIDETDWAYKTLREYTYLANIILREEITYVTKRENDLNA